MDIILYLLQLIQYQYKQICWLLNFICRYIPLKQWAFDDSHSPKYQKFKIDELPLITDFRQDWTYKELIPYYGKRHGKKIRPISRRSECNIPDSCPRCNAPKPFRYKNNAHVMSLCLTLHVNLGLSLRKTSQALKDLYNISNFHQQIANYCKTAAICIKPFVDQYPYEKNTVFTADETYCSQ